MPDSIARSDVRLDVGESTAPARVVEPDTPFRILVLGDFTGRANRGLRSSLAGRRPRQVDVDNLDDIMTEAGTALTLPGGTLRFRELEDFHPDRIYQRSNLFRAIDDMRTNPPRADTAAAATAAPAPARAPAGNLLDSILGDDEQSSASSAVENPGDLAAFINRVMRPHLVDKPDQQKLAWSAKIDAAAGEQMCAVLHHPQFQEMEALWRSLWMMLQRLETDSGLRVYLLDATLEELTAEPAVLEKLLSSGDPWAAIVGNYSFGQSPADVARLAALGRAARCAGGPFLAEGMPPEAALGEEWQALRRSPLAAWIGLTLPRFLVRLPYGRKTDAIDSFPFEEMPESVHNHYLWGNPAFCCAILLGLAFRRDGWDMHPGTFRRVEGLPLHVYQAAGESAIKPCAEVLLREKDAEYLLDNGLMALASLKEEDAALLVRFQSIADPPARLNGQWRS